MTTSAIQVERHAVRDELRAVGLPATADPMALDPPAVLVDVPQIGQVSQFGTACIKVELVLPIIVVGAGPGRDEQLAKMLEHVELVIRTLPRVAVAGDVAFTEPFVRGDLTELPAYRLSVPRFVELT